MECRRKVKKELKIRKKSNNKEASLRDKANFNGMSI